MGHWECAERDGGVALATGDVDQAERLLDEATAVLRHAGPWFLTLALYLRAILAVRRGNPDEAIALVRESLTRIRELHDKFAFVYALVPLAAAAVLKGDDAWAARILGARDAVTERTGATVVDKSVHDLREQTEREVRARLGQDRWARAYAAGRVTSIDSLIDDIDTMGKFFIENFIGTTYAARLCRIRNYKTLRFRHSKKKNILTAVADEPLIIENRELGYRITYQLEDFSYDFNQNTLFYLGYTLFEDMAKDTLKIPKRFLRERHAAYKGSIVHFIRSLYNNKLVENGFEVKRVKRIHNDEKDRVKAIMRGKFRHGDNADSSEYYDKILRQEDYEDIFSQYNLNADSIVSITGDKQRIMYFDNYIQVMYRDGFEERGYLSYTGQNRKPYHPRSLVFLLNGNPVTLDKNGSCYPATEFFSSGYWAWSEKISHLLPIEYDDAKGR